MKVFGPGPAPQQRGEGGTAGALHQHGAGDAEIVDGEAVELAHRGGGIEAKRQRRGVGHGEIPWFAG